MPRTHLNPVAMVPPSLGARRLARNLLLGALAFFVFCGFAPWQQTVSGAGAVMAFSPSAREQSIDATVSGRVARWFVDEGSHVRAGDPICELSDNDQDLMNRLGTERGAQELRLTAQEQRVTQLSERMESLRRSFDAQLQAAEAEVRISEQELVSAEQKLNAARVELETNEANLTRQKSLAESGLASARDRELAELSARKSEAEHASALANLSMARSRLTARQAAYTRTKATNEAELASAEASWRDAESSAADTKGRLARMDVEISRQAAQTVTAPTDGVIRRIFGRLGSQQVSRGQALALLVPDSSDRAVALEIDGNDAALVKEGEKVRLQFEGWPAVQFAGWPSVAVGTFGGIVSFVDPADSGAGDFRVIVVPDKNDDPWPEAAILRQGVRTKAWILLNQVRVGYEIWRRFNGFPPTVDRKWFQSLSTNHNDEGAPAKKGGK